MKCSSNKKPLGALVENNMLLFAFLPSYLLCLPCFYQEAFVDRKKYSANNLFSLKPQRLDLNFKTT